MTAAVLHNVKLLYSRYCFVALVMSDSVNPNWSDQCACAGNTDRRFSGAVNGPAETERNRTIESHRMRPPRGRLKID